MRLGLFGRSGISVALVMVFLGGCHWGGDTTGANLEGPKAGFVGSQKDYWCIMTPDRIRVTSELSVQMRSAPKGPMPIRLPYPNAQLEMVTFNGRELGFQKTGDGAYEIALPSDRLFHRQRQITCQWLLPVSELTYESGLYWTSPRSLIPVISYELRAGVDPQSGFETFGGGTEYPHVIRSWHGDVPRNGASGSCALPIRPRK